MSTGPRHPPTSLNAFNGCVIGAPVAVEEGKGLTPEQEACLVEAIGELAVREAKTGQRPPTSDEVDALVGCGIIEPKPDFDSLPEAAALADLALSPGPAISGRARLCSGKLPSENRWTQDQSTVRAKWPRRFLNHIREPNKVYMGVTVHDLTKGPSFRPIPRRSIRRPLCPWCRLGGGGCGTGG